MDTINTRKLSTVRNLYASDVDGALQTKLDYESRALLQILYKDPIPRHLRHLAEKGLLEPFMGDIGYNEELRFIEGLIYRIPKELLNFKNSGGISTYRVKRGEIKAGRRRRLVQIFSRNFHSPRVELEEVTYIDLDETPRIQLKNGYRTALLVDIWIYKQSKLAFDSSNENYLICHLYDPETLADNVTVWKAKGWSKKSIRAQKPILEDLFVARTDEVHTATKSRATALRGLTVRTKNKVINQVWDI